MPKYSRFKILLYFTSNRNKEYATQECNGIDPDGLLSAHQDVAPEVFLLTVSGVKVVLGGAAPHSHCPESKRSHSGYEVTQ